MSNLKEHVISHQATTAVALEKLSALGHNLTLFVIDDNGMLRGTLTDGDIRRGLIKGFNLKGSVVQFMNIDFKCIIEDNYTLDEIRKCKQKGIVLLPIVNSRMQIIKLINLNIQETILPVTAVIMAGGEGQRLRPLTETTPKSLLKVGSKPIIEHVIDKFVSYGIDKINISINYLGEQVIDYFKNGESKNIDISYIKETQKLGTAGALAFIEKIHHETILLMNGDLLTNINFEDFYTQFVESDADLMVACIPYSVNVPYAVLELEGKNVLSLKEKPTFTYYSNGGIYLIKKEHLNIIPKSKLYNATDLMEDLIAQKKKVIYYPILGFWLDIGNHEDYNRANKYIEQNTL